jgi:squalene-hopene/tetraprenyl-beta-curcumene cyclase
MDLHVDFERVSLAHKAVRAELLAERTPDGHWTGQLASSPFATAAAISALVLGHRVGTECALREGSTGGSQVSQLVQGDLCELLLESVHWLARHQNSDGGWGDCERGPSTLAATMLVQAAFRLTGIPAKYADLMVRADEFVHKAHGIRGLREQYGDDKPFVAAVLANLALADMVAWRQVPALAFEAACLPERWQRKLVSPSAPHELPAYVAIGLAKFYHDPPRNPPTRLLRRAMRSRGIFVLERLQNEDGGFTGSIPLTSFVVMSLASAGWQAHSLVDRGIEFLLASIRPDASWAVENNFAVRNTALAVNHLVNEHVNPATPPVGRFPAHGGIAISDRTSGSSLPWADTASTADAFADTSVANGSELTTAATNSAAFWSDEQVLDERCLSWLLDHQRVNYTVEGNTAIGGWGSSDSTAALPNTFDTASVLLAIARWRGRFAELQRERIEQAAVSGIRWLLDRQRGDGGWPTLPDASDSTRAGASSVEATAYTLRALAAWQRQWQSEQLDGAARRFVHLELTIDPAVERGLRHLAARQRADGRFVAQWFGNEHHPHGENPVIGTAQVLLACEELCRLESDVALAAARWLHTAQHSSGGWGPPRAPLDYSGDDDGFRAWRANDALARFCSVEETALAVQALMPFAESSQATARAVANGLEWLTRAVEQDAQRHGAVVGFYFNRLWYHERLYPLVFADGALSKAVRQLSTHRPVTVHVG